MQDRASADAVQHYGAKPDEARAIFGSLFRGAILKCPVCGRGAMFRRYLKVADDCPACGERLHHHRADDAPAYFTIVIVGHIVVSLVLAVEMAYRPDLWVHAALWLPLTVILTLLFLPAVKGALVGLQWALRMHGFDPNAEDEDEVEAFDDGATGQPRRLDFRS